MRLRKSLISTAIIISIALIFLSGFGYINSQVSYKYEVQDSQTIGKDPYYGLDEHQKQILKDIDNCKTVMIIFLILLVILIPIRLNGPTFNGRITYY